MDAPTAIITAESEQDAMDWSLVLASQEIETTLDRLPDEPVWLLIVPLADYERAMNAIQQYEIENCRRPWVSRLRWTHLLFDWRSAFWCLFLCIVFYFQLGGRVDISSIGRMDRKAVLHGEWWRMFTATSLHHDLPHLASNITTGFLLVGLAMGCYGGGPALLVCLLAGAGGNLAGLLLHEGEFRSLGASGSVMGALGMLTALSFAPSWQGAPLRLMTVRGLLAGIFIFILIGLNPRSDVVAHTGGFVFGTILGILLLQIPDRLLKHPRTDWVTALLCGGGMSLTWWLALTQR